MRRNDDKFQSFLSMERQGLLLAGIALKTVRDEKKAKKESQSVEKKDKPEKEMHRSSKTALEAMMKQLILKMIRDLRVFLIIGFLVLQLETMKWEVKISLLTSVYVVVEVIRLLFCAVGLMSHFP